MQRFLDWTRQKFADERMKCASYETCAELAATQLEALENGFGGDGKGSGDGNGSTAPSRDPYTETQLQALANVTVTMWDTSVPRDAGT